MKQCERCHENVEALLNVTSDIIDMHVCALCAFDAMDLGLTVKTEYFRDLVTIKLDKQRTLQ